jgi:MYXO-CTERM domain-containing protein
MRTDGPVVTDRPLEIRMKRVVLSAALALLAALPVAQAAPVQLVLGSPDLTAAVGTQADTGTGALDAGFTAAGGITLTELTWWGYHMPASSGTDVFEILLNGNLVGSESAPLGTITRQDTGVDLGDPGVPGVTVDLIRYTLLFAPGVVTAAGANTLSLVNDDFGAEWRWQATGAAANAPSAFALTGDVSQPVPEPAGLLLALSALAAAVAARRRT